MRDSCELTVAARGERDAQRSGRIWLNCANETASACGCAGSARPILSRRATAPGSVGCRRRGPACPRRAELRAHLQRRLHGLARGAAAPHPRRLRDVSQPDHEMAFGHAGAAGRLPQGDRHPPERRLGPAPRLRHRGRHGPGGDAWAGCSPRSRNAFAAEKSASATSATRTSRRPSRSGRKSRRGRRSARRAWVFGTCTSRSG